uniref:Uncharacterized protein n=1 Tax=Mycena chlorophos TaxID=658473 RepID=A0ABQ0L6Q4_MYCCL|nr:predicted protein [Mycena chlorophos]
MGRLSPDEIRAKDRERKARRKAMREDPERWQTSLERARESSRKYRIGYASWLNAERRRKRAMLKSKIFTAELSSRVNLKMLFLNSSFTRFLMRRPPLVNLERGECFALVSENEAAALILINGPEKNEPQDLVHVDLSFSLSNIRANNPKIWRSDRSLKLTPYMPGVPSTIRFEFAPEEANPEQFTVETEVLSDVTPFLRRETILEGLDNLETVKLELQETVQYPVEDPNVEEAIVNERDANFISSTVVDGLEKVKLELQETVQYPEVRAKLTGNDAMKAEEAAVTPLQIFNALMMMASWAVSDDLARNAEASALINEEEILAQIEELSEEASEDS